MAAWADFRLGVAVTQQEGVGGIQKHLAATWQSCQYLLGTVFVHPEPVDGAGRISGRPQPQPVAHDVEHIRAGSVNPVQDDGEPKVFVAKLFFNNLESIKEAFVQHCEVPLVDGSLTSQYKAGNQPNAEVELI